MAVDRDGRGYRAFPLQQVFATNNLSTDFFAAEKVLAEWLDDNGRCLVGNFGSDSAPYEGFGACLPRNFRVRVPQADLNDDGKFDATDRALAASCRGTVVPGSLCERADLDANGKVTSAEAKAVKNALVSFSAALAVGRISSARSRRSPFQPPARDFQLDGGEGFDPHSFAARVRAGDDPAAILEAVHFEGLVQGIY